MAGTLTERPLARILLVLVCLYAPYAWLVLIDYPWDSYRWQLIKIWLVLPGILVHVSQTIHLVPNWIGFLIIGTVTLVRSDRNPAAHSEEEVAEAKRIEVGDPAPDFTLLSSSGETVSLSDFRGREVVLFFYPKDKSPLCTTEACSFRDSHEAFLDVGAEVIGISTDSPESHRRFANRFRLPYRLLSDIRGDVRDRYGVPKTFGLIPGRVTYVIDREGVVRHIFSSQFKPARHVTEALTVLRTLRSDRGTN